ncbi:MAG: type VII toxin-antitoxin system HepT family RNase toxin [Acidiferrobacterales bacterium]
MADDVVLNKAAIIERCLARIADEYNGHEKELSSNLTRQDAIILNLQRACEAAIDLAMHVVRVHQLGLPQESREAFTLLQTAGILNDATGARMRAMVGFRNIAIPNYQKLSLDVVRPIFDGHLDDFRGYIASVIKAPGSPLPETVLPG